MAGKGSRFRLVSDKAKFNDNWDKIFAKGKEVDKNLWWKHQCKHNGEIILEKGAVCNFCGEIEQDD